VVEPFGAFGSFRPLSCGPAPYPVPPSAARATEVSRRPFTDSPLGLTIFAARAWREGRLRFVSQYISSANDPVNRPVAPAAGRLTGFRFERVRLPWSAPGFRQGPCRDDRDGGWWDV